MSVTDPPTAGPHDEVEPVVDRWTRLEQLVPPYPAALFDILNDACSLPVTPVVVDLGAGSGRGSLPMAQRGWRVTAVDIDPDAVAGLTARAMAHGLEIRVVVAPAEATGLDAASADLVTSAHAYHWFEPDSALAEIARLTRFGGAVALFWTMRVPESPGPTTAHRELLTRYGVAPDMFLEAQIASDAAGAALAAASAFERVERHDVIQPWSLSVDDAMELGTMPGYIRSLEPARAKAFRAELAALFERFADPAAQTITETFRTSCWTARRSST